MEEPKANKISFKHSWLFFTMNESLLDSTNIFVTKSGFFFLSSMVQKVWQFHSNGNVYASHSKFLMPENSNLFTFYLNIQIHDFT